MLVEIIFQGLLFSERNSREISKLTEKDFFGGNCCREIARDTYQNVLIAAAESEMNLVRKQT